MVEKARKFSKLRQSLIKSAISALPAKQRASVGPLADIVFGRAPEEDLEVQSPKSLAAMLLQAKKVEQSKRDTLSVEDLDGAHCLITIGMKNRPFIVDSVLAAISDSGHHIQLITHPLLERGGQGLWSLVMVLLPRISRDEAKALKASLRQTLDQVKLVTNDWQPMLMRLGETVAELRVSPPRLPANEIAEAIQFIEWLSNNNFTLMGLRTYAWEGDREAGTLVPTKNSGLGILKDPNVTVMKRGGEAVVITPEIREFLYSDSPLIITKANVRSLVHRRAYLDYVGIKRYHPDGSLAGELRLIGLFTSTAYTKSVLTIPLLRHKVNTVLEEFKADPSSHSGKALINILETWPRDELFQLDPELLGEFAGVAVQLEERPRVRVLSRAERFDRFVSVIVYVPRERYDSNKRVEIGNYLSKVFKGRLSAWYPNFLENGLTRVHFIVGRDSGKTPRVERKVLEAEVSDIVRTWEDRVRDAAMDAGQNLPVYSWPVSYQQIMGPDSALKDAVLIDGLSGSGEIALGFHSADPHDEECLDPDSPRVALKLFHIGSAVPLSERVPMLENLGFRVIEESTHDIGRPEGDDVFLHDMVLENSYGHSLDREALDQPLKDCLQAVWNGLADNDGFNALVLAAGLSWQEAGVFRAYSRYLRQIRSRFSVESMAETLTGNPKVARQLIDLFNLRFNPKISGRAAKEAEQSQAILQSLENIYSSDDDRILRNFLSAISATLRTNYFQAPISQTSKKDGESHEAPAPVLTFKLDPSRISIMPKPVPYRELFVSSPIVEGTHLRFGPVARGGLRWSDRAQDYRTEVLGLVKAQQVKNAVIVPVGAKGGFLPKQLPSGGDRNAFFEAGRAAYRVYISSLLSVTDNLASGKLIKPKDVVRHDGDDPYFVVAADKGTATFSDTANGISQAYEFWLDDAFASGGSAGYDHKKMGITARGGWEAVKRHFREMDRDIQTQPFTAAGVGDMSGDVFGNGMLLSKETLVVAAFDHRDIFIDPTPDAASSFRERLRLFKKDRSSWQDYNRDLISKGGDVFARSAKSVTLSKEAAAAMGCEAGEMTPQELLVKILKAPVDLMWFGGIGTYIKAADESHADAGDRSNDQIRINANEVRAKVIGEGANLGITQRGRIAFNQAGGRSNTDAIDNSAGVNSSDVEVNIKIAFSDAMQSGKLKRARRNVLLEQMTEEVGELVLRNNYQQTLSLSLAERLGMDDMAHQQRLMHQLEARDRLDRAVEDLPDDIAIAERMAAGQPLSRPEISVLFAYAKIVALDDLLETKVPDDPYLERELVRYFPAPMQNDFEKQILNHRLRREIIATVLSNSMINRGGPTFISRITDQTGASVERIARAFVAVRDSYKTQAINNQIDALDNKISGELQLELYSVVQKRVIDLSIWFCRYSQFDKGLSPVIDLYGSSVDAIMPRLEKVAPIFLADRITADADRYIDGGVPKDLAWTLARLRVAGLIPDICLSAQETGAELDRATKVFFEITNTFGVGRLVEAARGIETSDYYDSLALDRALQSLNHARRQIVVQILSVGSKKQDDCKLWLEKHADAVSQTQQQLNAIMDHEQSSVSRLMVAANVLGDLARG